MLCQLSIISFTQRKTRITLEGSVETDSTMAGNRASSAEPAHSPIEHHSSWPNRQLGLSTCPYEGHQL